MIFVPHRSQKSIKIGESNFLLAPATFTLFPPFLSALLCIHRLPLVAVADDGLTADDADEQVHGRLDDWSMLVVTVTAL